jgi:exo-beta-1,3-glucanase (GH17 family)
MRRFTSITSRSTDLRPWRPRIRAWAAKALVLATALAVTACSTTGPPKPTKTGSSPTPTPSTSSEIRGLGFSPFRNCQSPNLHQFPNASQMHEDVDIIAAHANALRTYSVLNGMDDAAAYAVSKGLKVSAGAWLGPEQTAAQRAANRAEIEALVSLANRVHLYSVIVGNEVLLRHDLSPWRLAAYIEEVKARVHVPVTTAEIAGVLMRPENRIVVDVSDYLLVHIYPYWDGISIGGAAWYVADKYAEARKAAGGKRVVIGETGWPSAGPAHGAAVPSLANARRFLAEWMAVAANQRIDYYYFSAFDEIYKTEGGVGPHWGIMTSGDPNPNAIESGHHPKFDISDLRATPAAPPPHPSVYRSSAPATPPQTTFPIYTDWLQQTDYIPSGYMGDTKDITIDECWLEYPHSGTTSIRVEYTGDQSRGMGWAGVYWLSPANNWGTDPHGGRNLQGFHKLTFFAGNPVPDYGGCALANRITFFAGGVTGPYGDSMSKHAITVDLTSDWQQYTINLGNADLRRVVGAFGWSASAVDNPRHGTRGGLCFSAVFYLDDIQFEK